MPQLLHCPWFCEFQPALQFGRRLHPFGHESAKAQFRRKERPLPFPMLVAQPMTPLSHSKQSI